MKMGWFIDLKSIQLFKNLEKIIRASFTFEITEEKMDSDKRQLGGGQKTQIKNVIGNKLNNSK